MALYSALALGSVGGFIKPLSYTGCVCPLARIALRGVSSLTGLIRAGIINIINSIRSSSHEKTGIWFNAASVNKPE
jgi:hypothetical protein